MSNADTRELNREELEESIDSLEDRIDVLSEEIEIIDRDMVGLQAQDEDYAELHERRFEVSEEICRTAICKRIMREKLEAMGGVYYVMEVMNGEITRLA